MFVPLLKGLVSLDFMFVTEVSIIQSIFAKLPFSDSGHLGCGDRRWSLVGDERARGGAEGSESELPESVGG